MWICVPPERADDYLVELARAALTDAPELFVDHASWSDWLTTCPKRLDVAVDPAYLRRLTAMSDPEDRELFPWLLSVIHDELGLPLPAMTLYSDPALPPRAFALEINGFRTTSWVGFDNGLVLTSHPPDQDDPSALTAPNPLTAREGSLVPSARADELEEEGYTTWTERQYLGDCGMVTGWHRGRNPCAAVR